MSELKAINLSSTRNFLSYVILIASLYLYIYSPPFRILPFGPIKVLIPFAYFYIFKNNLLTQFFSLFRKDFWIITILLGYIITISFLLRSDFSRILTVSYYLFEVFPVAFYLSHRYLKLTKTGNIPKILVKVTFIAALFSLFIFLNPGLKDFIRFSLMRFEESDKSFQFRSFSISADDLFTYSIVQGIASFFVFYFIKENRIKWFAVMLLLYFSALINARTGLVVGLIGAGIYFLFQMKSIKKFISNFGVLVLVAILIVIFFQNFESFFGVQQASGTKEWLVDGMNQVTDIFSDDKQSDYSILKTLTEDMVYYPDDFWTWIFGSGKDLFYSEINSSDVGYVRQLNFGGLIYIFLLFWLVARMLNRIYTSTKDLKLYVFFNVNHIDFKLKRRFF